MDVGQVYNPWRAFIGCITPNSIMRCRELSSTAKNIFARLSQYAGQNGQAYPSYKVLGKEVGIGTRQAIRGVDELEKFGLIRVVKRRRADGGTTSNVYQFIWQPILEASFVQDPSVRNSMGGSDTEDTSPKCSKRHMAVPEVSPKKNQIQDSSSEEITNKQVREQIRMLVANTPFSQITGKELELLLKRHGADRVKECTDIAAEECRKKKKVISNPGGYLQALCVSCNIPREYVPQEVRVKISNVADERKRLAVKKEQETNAARKSEEKARDRYWQSLSAEERSFHIAAARESSSFTANISFATIEMVAKCNVWELRTQMRTNSLIQS